MSLYLCIFEGDEEAAGVEVGSYADFNALRDYIVRELEGGAAGSRFPTLVLHSDCDGEWPVEVCAKLREELAVAIDAMRRRPPLADTADRQEAIARSLGRPPRDAAESFLAIDGGCLPARLQELAEIALQRRQPILFQ